MLLLFISIFISKAIGGSAPFAGITDVLNSNEDGYFRPQVEYEPWGPSADLQYNFQINYPVLPHLQQPKSEYRAELFEFPAVSNYPLTPQNEYHHWSDYDLYDIPGERADMSHSFDEAHADAFDLGYDAGYDDYYSNFANYEYDPGYYEMDVNDYGMEANDYGMDVNNHGMDVNDYWMDFNNYINSQFQGNQPNYQIMTSPILNDQFSNSVNPGRHSDPYNFENHFQLPSNNAKRRGKRSTGFIDEVFEDSYQPEVITEDIVEPQEVFYEDLLPIHSEEIVKDDDDFDVFFPPSSPGEAPSSYEAQFADLLMKIKGDKMGNKHPHKGITVKSPVEINLPFDDYDAFSPMPPSGHLSPINVGNPFNQDFSPIASPIHESPINVGNPFDDYTEDYEDYSPLPPPVQESPISVANFRPVVTPFSEPSVTISNPLNVPIGDYEEYDPMLPPYEMEIAEPLDVSSHPLDIQNSFDDDYKEFNPMLLPYELEIANAPNPSFEDSSDVQNSFDDDHEEYNPMLPIHQSNIVKDVERPQNTVPLNTVDSYLKPMNAPYLRPVGSKPKQSQALKMPSQNLNLQRNFGPQPPAFVMPPVYIPPLHAPNLADNDDTDDDDADTQVRVLPPIHLPPEASPESEIPIPTPQQSQSLKMPSPNLNMQRNFRPQPPAFVMPPDYIPPLHAQNLADNDDTDDDEDADTQVRVLPPIHLPPTSHDSDSPLPAPIALRSGFHGLVDGLDNAYGTENSQTQDDLDTENSYLPLPSGPVIVEPVNNDVTNSMSPVTNPKVMGSSNIQGNWNTMNVNNNRQTVANWQQSGGRFQGTNNRIMPTINRQQIVQNQQNSQQSLTNNNQWKAQNNRVNQNGMLNMNRNVNQQNMQNNLMRQQNRQNNVVRQNNMQNNAIRQNNMQNNVVRQNNMQNNAMMKQNMQNNAMMQRNVQNNVMRQRNMQNNVMRQRNMQNRMNIGNQNQMTNLLGGFSPF